MIHVDDEGAFSVERIDILHEKKAGTEEQEQKDREIISKDPRGLISNVMADIDKGRSTEQITKKYGISTELTETISRMYLTHPGVDVDGIMTKMGR